jgi:hypothetical protein
MLPMKNIRYPGLTSSAVRWSTTSRDQVFCAFNIKRRKGSHSRYLGRLGRAYHDRSTAFLFRSKNRMLSDLQGKKKQHSRSIALQVVFPATDVWPHFQEQNTSSCFALLPDMSSQKGTPPTPWVHQETNSPPGSIDSYYLHDPRFLSWKIFLCFQIGPLRHT